MSSLRSVTDDLKRPLAENEVWTLLNMSLESLSASYRDFRPSRHLNKSSIGPFLIISVEGLLLRKNSVQFNSGLQSEAAPDVAAPELLKKDGGINSMEALQKTHIFSLGTVLRMVMRTDSISYSQKLIDTLDLMIKLDPTLRPSLQDIMQIVREELDNHQNDVSSLFDTINEMWEGSSHGEPNLAAEIAEIELTHSGGSSLSINSHESTDAMSRPLSVGSHKRPISWSSQERLKIKDQEKSQFYTPVRNRRKEGDDTLPPLPPSVSRKKPHKTPAMEGGDIPLLPPPVVAPGSPLKVPPPKPPRSDLVLTSTPNAPGKCSVLDSVKMIENILESNSAPDLLSKDLSTTRHSSSTPPPHYKIPVDLFTDTSTGDVNDDPPPPPPPTVSPPTMSPPKPSPSSSVSPINYHESLHESKDTFKDTDILVPSLSAPPAPPPDSTFDYTSSLNVTHSLNEESVSTNEFKLDHIDSETAQKSTLDDESQNKEEDSNEAPPPVPPKRTRSIKADPSTVTDTAPVKDEAVNPPILAVNEDATLPSTNDQRLLLTSIDDTSPGLIPEDIPLLSTDPHHSYVLPPEAYPGSMDDMMSYGQVEVIESSLSPSFSDVTDAHNSRSKINKVLGKDDETPRSLKLKRRNSQKFYLESHIVKIEALGMTSTHLRIKPSATGQELLSEAAKKLCISDQAETLGIAIEIDEEFIFLEPDKRIHKYAPIGWKKWKPGAGRSMPRFTVHLRVMYFPLNISMLSLRESRHLHYEQTFHDIVNGLVHVTKEEAILLAGLALQAQFGDYRGQVNYFKPIHYIPKNVLREMKNQNIHETLRTIHEQRKRLTRQKAEHQYLREAAKLADYGYIYYRVSLTKDWSDDCSFLLGFSTKGLRLCHDESDGTRTIDLQCPWKTTTKIAFKDNILLLEVVGQDPIQVYADDYKRARYYVRLSQMYHFFDRSYRDCSYPTPLDVRDVIIHNVLDYRGSFIAVKIVKHESKGLGITLTGHSGKSQKFAEIKAIKQDTPAAIEGTLQTGDLLVEANRLTLINKPHKEVGKILLELPPLVELKIFRRANFRIEDSLLLNVTVERADNRELSFSNIEMARFHSTRNEVDGIRESSFIEPDPLPNSLSVKVKRLSTGSTFGFSVEHKEDLFHISKIVPGGAVEQTGQISIGDQLLSINGDSVDGKSKQDVFKILKEFPGEELEIEIASSKVPETNRKEEDTWRLRTGEDTDRDDAVFQRKGTLVTDSRILDESGAARSLSLSSDKLKTVKMTKKNNSFGFAIKRSSKNPYSAVQVSKITPGGAADETGAMSLGDQIVSVNGVCVDGKGYREVYDMLYKAGAAHEMELEFCPQDDGSHVTITLDKSKPLGLRIKEDNNGSIVVSSVIEGSQAQKTGQVHKGDELVEVNGTTLRGLSMREATELLLRSDSPLYIYIKKSPVNVFHMLSQIKEDQSELDSESKPTDDDKYVHFTVTLTKGTRGFGFKIKKSLSDERDERGLFIASVDFDPAVSDGQLRSGDEIIKFNGNNFIGIPNNRGVAMMKSAADTGVMVIRRQKEDIQSSIHESQDTGANASAALLTQEVSPEDDNASSNSIELKTLTKEMEENEEQKEEESTINDVEVASGLEPVATELISKEEPDKVIEGEPAVNEPQDAAQNVNGGSSEVTEQEAIATSPAQ